MLTLVVAARELFNEQTQSFVQVSEQTICLEHSLISLRRWEAIWQKPYFSNTQKTDQETLDYIRCMSVNKDISLETVMCLTSDQLAQISQYISSPMTATTFAKDNTPPSRQIMTSEIIYWQMIQNQIPFECQKWHLNQLLTLLRVCGIKNQKPKKMGKRETMSRNAQLNQTRKAQLNTRG